MKIYEIHSHEELYEWVVNATHGDLNEAVAEAKKAADKKTYVVEKCFDYDETSEQGLPGSDEKVVWDSQDPESEGNESSGDAEETVNEEDLDESFLDEVTEEDDLIVEGIKLRTKEEQDEFFRLCQEIGIVTAGDLMKFKDEVGCSDEDLLQALRDYREELGPDFEIKEEIDYDALVEEMEENEDEVECKFCNDIFPKSDCVKERDMGYLCDRCYQEIRSRGERLDLVVEEVTNESISQTDLFKEFEEAGYETEAGSYDFDTIYDNYKKKNGKAPESVEDIIEFVKAEVSAHYDAEKANGNGFDEASKTLKYRVMKKASLARGADGSAIIEEIEAELAD